MKSLSPGTLILGIFAMLLGWRGRTPRSSTSEGAPRGAGTAGRPNRAFGGSRPAHRPHRDPGRRDARQDDARADEESQFAAMMMLNSKQVIGRTVREPVKTGQAFTLASLYPEGTGPSVAETLKPGCRAVTVDLQGNTGDIAMVQPGTIVDVIFRTHADKAAQIQEATVTLLEAVEVLAVGPQLLEGAVTRPDPNRGQQSFPVTLAVTPDQAKALKTVEGRGTISLSVRNQKDTRVAAVAQAQTLASLLNLPQPEPPFVTQIYRGGRATKMEFQNGEIRETPPPAIVSTPVAAVSGGLETSAEPTAGTVEENGSGGKSSCTNCQRNARSIVKRGSQTKRFAARHEPG